MDERKAAVKLLQLAREHGEKDFTKNASDSLRVAAFSTVGSFGRCQTVF
jgi:hypothetical protein